MTVGIKRTNRAVIGLCRQLEKLRRGREKDLVRATGTRHEGVII